MHNFDINCLPILHSHQKALKKSSGLPLIRGGKKIAKTKDKVVASKGKKIAEKQHH